MINVIDSIRVAIDRHDAKLAAKVVDHLRFNRDLNYFQILEFVQKVRPNVPADQWEELLSECEGTEGAS